MATNCALAHHDNPLVCINCRGRYAINTSAMDNVCRLRKEKVEASKCAFLYTVYPAGIEYVAPP